MAKIVEEIILKITLKDDAGSPLKGYREKTDKAKKSTDALLKSTKKFGVDVNKTFSKADNDARALSQGFRKLQDNVDKGFKKGKKSATGFSKALKLIAAVGIAATLKRLVFEGVNVALQFDKVNNSLKSVLGTTSQANREFDFLVETSNRLGLNTLAIAGSYTKLIAATKGSNITMAQSRELFLGVSEASAALGLSASDTEGALRAIQQIASKGRVSLEELTGQLGERLPGALGIAAKAMGVTQQQLIKMVETGEVMAEDLLPKLGRALREEFGAAAEEVAGDSAQAKVNRLANAWDKMLSTVGNSASKFIPIVTTMVDRVDESLLLLDQWKDAALGIDNFKLPISQDDIDTKVAQNRRKKALEEEKRLMKELAAIAKENAGFNALLDLGKFQSELDFLEKESGLSATNFAKIAGELGKSLKGGRALGKVLDDLNKFTGGAAGKRFFDTDEIKTIGTLPAIFTSLNKALEEFGAGLRNNVIKSFDDLIDKGEEFKSTFSLAKELGLTRTEFEQISGLLNQARIAGLPTDDLKAKIDELRAEGLIGKGQGAEARLGGGVTNIQSGAEATAFLHGQKVVVQNLEANKRSADTLEALLDEFRENGFITATLSGS